VSAGSTRQLIIALDFNRIDLAYSLARRLASLAGMFKIGGQLFTAEGPSAVKRLASLGPQIFLDLKFHDIPNTVAGAASAAARLPGVRLITIHALGGAEMMSAAARALGSAGGKRNRPKLLGVTILTSFDAAAMRRVGIAGRPGMRAVRLAQLAKGAGLDGVVASAHDVAAIRHACGGKFLIVVPGVRPAGLGTAEKRPRVGDDQARVATPAEAIRAGADYIVVGRPITAARDPRAAAAAILEEISLANRQRI
jgi:orotidine-5'-phosphate decarboxylase